MEEILKILLHPAILIIQTPIDCKNLPRKEHIWQFADITPERYNGLSKDVEAATRDVLQKKGVLKNFAEFTGKQLCQSLFFNKVAGLRCATLLKKRLWHRYFPGNFAKSLRTPFLTEDLRWLLLSQQVDAYLSLAFLNFLRDRCQVLFLILPEFERISYPANIYQFKIKNRITRKRCES